MIYRPGHKEPTVLVLRQRPVTSITITDGPSGGTADEGWHVNMCVIASACACR